MRLEDIDLTELDRFAHGFPHELFTTLRRDAPVWFHPPTAHTPGDEGFWVLVALRRRPRRRRPTRRSFSSETGPGRAGGGGTLIEDLPPGLDRRAPQHDGRPPAPADPPARHAGGLGACARDSWRPSCAAGTPRSSTPSPRAASATSSSTSPPSSRCRRSPSCMGVPQDDRHDLFRWADATLDYDDRELGRARARRRRRPSANMQAYGIGADRREAPASPATTSSRPSSEPASKAPTAPTSRSPTSSCSCSSTC